MTGNDEDISLHAIEKARTLNRSLASKVEEQGVSREDVTIAGLYSAFDLATGFTGSRTSAIEWLRTGVEAIERQVMSEMTKK